MNRFRFINAILIVVVIIGAIESCTNSNRQQAEEVEYSSAKEYATDNSFLDVDLQDIQNYLVTPSTKNPNTGAQIEKAKAAIYRFYSNVTVEDGQYVCKIESGKQINISDRTFNELMDNLNKMNSSIREIRERGESVNIQPVTEEYLSGLLK